MRRRTLARCAVPTCALGLCWAGLSGATQQAGHLFIVVVELNGFAGYVHPSALEYSAHQYANEISTLFPPGTQYGAVGIQEANIGTACQRARTCDVITVSQHASSNGSRSDFYFQTRAQAGSPHGRGTPNPIPCSLQAQGRGALSRCRWLQKSALKVFVDSAEATYHWRRRRGS